jgi:hypothetical protein
MKTAIAQVKTSFAYDTEGKRTPERDNVFQENLEYLNMNEEEIRNFMNGRYPKAIDWRVDFVEEK